MRHTVLINVWASQTPFKPSDIFWSFITGRQVLLCLHVLRIYVKLVCSDCGFWMSLSWVELRSKESKKIFPPLWFPASFSSWGCFVFTEWFKWVFVNEWLMYGYQLHSCLFKNTHSLNVQTENKQWVTVCWENIQLSFVLCHFICSRIFKPLIF